MSAKVLTVKQTKSAIGRSAAHQACLRGLGIRRMHQVVKVVATPENLGMLNQVNYMLEIREN